MPLFRGEFGSVQFKFVTALHCVPSMPYLTSISYTTLSSIIAVQSETVPFPIEFSMNHRIFITL